VSISTANPQVATLTRYRFTAAGGETSESGIDDNGAVLAYVVGKEQVYLNGVLLVRGSDYTASNGTSITALSPALVAGDVLEILTFSEFVIANAVDQNLVSAKGDLIVATADNTVTNLAVGSNGDTIVADSSTSTGLRYQEPKTLNSLINGGADIWQRGTSFSSGNGLSIYSADRWHFYRGSNAAGATLSRQTSGLTGFQYAIRLQRNSGNTSIESIGLRYTLESADSYRLAGKTVTLSYYLRKGADYSGTNFRATIASGTGTDQPVYAFTGFAYAADVSVAPTGSWVRYSITGTIPSNATEVGLEMFSNAAGTAGTNDYVDVTGFQLEIGSVPTPFVRSAGTIQEELAACQRYYVRFNAGNGYGNVANAGYTSASTGVNIFSQFPVQMRSIPSAIDFANLGYLDSSGSGASVSSPSAAAQGVYFANIGWTTAGATVGRFAWLRDLAGAGTGYLGFSAEL
jgi:hypothetical protein